jgi:hypothetical protein
MVRHAALRDCVASQTKLRQNQDGVWEVSSMSRLRVALFAIVAMTGISRVIAGQDKPLSVCQALKFTRDHEEVDVRGEISGWRHGYFLSESTKADPCPGWQWPFLTGPSTLPLEFVSSSGVQLTERQARLNRDFIVRWRRLNSESGLNHFPFTVTGVMVRKPWPMIFRHADGTYFGTGFGPDGAYSAFLVMKSIREEGK